MVAELPNKTDALAIVKSIESNNIFNKLTVDELNSLGYELSGRQLPMGNAPIRYALMDIKNEDNKLEVGFCYLYSVESQTGIILPNTFGYYLKKIS